VPIRIAPWSAEWLPEWDKWRHAAGTWWVVTEESSGESEGLLARLTAGSRVAGYRLQDQIGAGGMAVVFRARDERLGRVVALKVLAPALAADPGFRQRFIAESRAAAAVDDPHIIPVYEAGEAGGVLFIAMRFVPGGDLRSVAGPVPPDRAAEIISAVASALDAAHGAGLVHRDVKPGNVLVDVRPGRPDHVYLSDFGLSKGVLSSAGVTATGQFVGTPDFSAPEQVAGAAVDGRVDQYALGCLAFWLLAGTAPFTREPPVAVLWAHLSEPPPRLSERRPGLPPAVDEVLARALAKAPANRYRSCGEFAAALAQALSPVPPPPAGPDPAVAGPRDGGTPRTPTLAARPPGGIASQDATMPPTVTRVAQTAVPVRPQTESAELPAAAAGSSTGLAEPAVVTAGPDELPAENAVGSVTGPGGAVGADRPGPGSPPSAVGADRPGPRSQPADGASRARPSRRARRGALVGAALVIAVAGGITAALELPSRPPAGPARLEVSVRRIVTLSSPHGAGDAAEFSPDGQILAVAGADGVTELWNLPTRRADRRLYGSGPPGATTAAFSPDGRILATADLNGHAYLWAFATGKLIATLTGPRSKGVDDIAFSPDGRTLAVIGVNGRAELWDVATRRVTTTLTDPGGKGVVGVAFSPDGLTLATGGFNGQVRLWDLAAHRYIATLPNPRGQGGSPLAFSPDGRILATVGGDDKAAYLWDVRTRRRLATLADPRGGAVSAFSFSPDGRILAVADGNGNTYLWDVATGGRVATLADPHAIPVLTAEFSPVGLTVATCDFNGRVLLWRITERQPRR
jgi:DNA-binding beta-propeller fold protein YncE